MNKKAILKKAKHDLEFRRKIISKLQIKMATGTFGDLVNGYYSSITSHLQKLLTNRKWKILQVDKSSLEIRSQNGKDFFINWGPPEMGFRIRVRFLDMDVPNSSLNPTWQDFAIYHKNSETLAKEILKEFLTWIEKMELS